MLYSILQRGPVTIEDPFELSHNVAGPMAPAAASRVVSGMQAGADVFRCVGAEAVSWADALVFLLRGPAREWHVRGLVDLDHATLALATTSVRVAYTCDLAPCARLWCVGYGAGVAVGRATQHPGRTVMVWRDVSDRPAACERFVNKLQHATKAGT